MFIMIGCILHLAIKAVFRLTDILLRLIFFPMEVFLWMLRFLLFG